MLSLLGLDAGDSGSLAGALCAASSRELAAPSLRAPEAEGEVTAEAVEALLGGGLALDALPGDGPAVEVLPAVWLAMRSTAEAVVVAVSRVIALDICSTESRTDEALLARSVAGPLACATRSEALAA